ncbi:MAG: transglycosylase domain-containing protein, partial [Deltaproteobacteria bacterium]|nr:transglycosylase domain-containing protein [Deltaproteobacteria bacterium]
MIRWIIRIFLLILLLVIVCGAMLFGVLYRNVSEEAKTHIERGIIDAVIFSESPVFYDDGKSVIGVFFEKTHRKYIHFKDIPPIFVKAIVAAEDQKFYSHYGFDPKAILRAAIANFKSKRISQGGSTITQQTAKNIFEREKRSYAAKLKELIQALLLERKYSKDEILEMYVNQFFVTGFGRGLSIASKYFFDKEPEKLDLVESAFIAGSVKSPNRFNPFIKKSSAEKNKARRLAKQRKDYVLSNMLEMNYITRAEYQEAVRKEVPFKEGRVTFRLNVILDYIRDQLDSEYFKNILQEQGVENIATSGLKVYTSVNKEMQEGALQSLRKHLPLLDVKLTGVRGDLFLDKYRDLVGDPMKKPEEDIAFFGRITAVRADKENPAMAVSWDGGEGIIDYEGMRPIGDAWLKGKTGVWAEFGKRHILDFLKLFEVGQIVAIRHTGAASSEGKAQLLLSKIPDLDGGVVVLRKGTVKAMVGGFFDRFFNRAVDAKRQLGSIFKTLVYAAALELKWNTLDPLQNRKNVFPFQTTLYIPKADHQPGSERVSMLWAGAKSENLATVWLLYHLTDQLTMNEFREVADLLGLGRTDRETYQEYVSRIRDRYGVMVSDEDVRAAAFEECKQEIETDLIFEGQEEVVGNLQRMHYKVDSGSFTVDGEMEPSLERFSFLRFAGLNESMKQELQRIKEVLTHLPRGEGADLKRLFGEELSRFFLTGGEGDRARVVYAEKHPSEGGVRPLNSEWDGDRLAQVKPDEVWIEGILPSRVVDLILSMSDRAHERIRGSRKYDLNVLYRVSDFRRVVNLNYVARLAERMGIATKLDPVLSFPLGANSISILEAALSYESMMTGKIYPLDGITSPDMLPIITRIEDRQGKLIWEYEPRAKRVLSERVSGMVTDILRMVMIRGTGRAAKDAVQLNLEIENQKVSIPVPSFGKTGTANKFTNSSFVGFIPGPDEKTGYLTIEDGYVIASYVGYDDNRPMKGRSVVIYGSSGAMPLYVDTGNAVVNSREYKQKLHMADLAFELQTIPGRTYSDLQAVAVSPTSGLPVGSYGRNS